MATNRPRVIGDLFSASVLAVSTSEQLVHLPRGPVRVRTHGEGLPLLWTHGMFHPIDVDDHTTIGGVLNDLPGFRVVRWDTRGHGRTPPSERVEHHRWDELGGELLALADALGLDAFVAGGISMGAALTLHAAVRAPERVRAMLLLAPPTGWETRPAQNARYRELAALPGPREIADKVEQEIVPLFPDGVLPPPLQVMMAGIRGSPPRALERVLHGAAESDLPSRAALARLPIPTTVLAWGGDSGHPFETAESIVEALPRASMRVIGGFEDGAALAAALDDVRASL
jgi:3-oxoadipate enol-lactonase